MHTVTPGGHGLGWRPSLPDIRDVFQLEHTLGATPSTVDLRDSGLMPPVYDQGQLGSCTANAVAGAIQIEAKRAGRDATITPSRLFIYYEERRIEGSLSQGDVGAMGRDGFRVATHEGVPNENRWPYHVGDYATVPPPAAYANDDYTIEGYTHPIHTAEAFKSAIAHQKPIAFGFTVYESFESAVVDDTAIIPLPSHGEQVLGGHEVLIVGYLTHGDVLYFIIRNSWGSNWAEGGYAYMPADYVLNRNLAGDWRMVRHG